jgi:predicted molibdopterin-dependent oxidoreductase YjgC
MVKFKIDNNLFEAAEGSTILEIAEREGIDIPTMCHKKGIPHYSSCMVCMIKDNRTGNYLPSCSALVQEGMDIDASCRDVIELRKKALELLLAEHRAECEAPCRVVCPAGYNIPLMNRLFTAKDYNGVVELIQSEIKAGEIKCIDCAAYCENACRRKKIDNPVSIRNMKLFISKHLNRSDSNAGISENIENDKPLKRFTSRIGRIEVSEQQEWLKECINDVSRFREISDLDSACHESESCMHCDCRAADDCRLRELADTFSMKDPRGKIMNSPIVKKINHKTGLIFENAKCIKCGLCVRVCEDTTDEPALCFINRGFVSIISEPLTAEFDDILNTKSRLVVDICPTGALGFLKDSTAPVETKI